MNNLLSFLFSCVENFALLFFVLSLFRFKIPEYKAEMLITTFIVAITSFTLIKFNLMNINMVALVLMLILAFKYLFKFKLLFSTFVTICGYIIYALVQSAVLLILDYYNVIVYPDIKPFTWDGYILQSTSAIIMMVISLYIIKSNSGFSFDFGNSFIQKKIKKRKSIVVLNIITLILVAISYFNLIASYYLTSIILFTVVMLILTSVIIYMSLKHNKEYLQ